MAKYGLPGERLFAGMDPGNYGSGGRICHVPEPRFRASKRPGEVGAMNVVRSCYGANTLIASSGFVRRSSFRK